ncbi:hypothetical protein EVAR_93681_1 [Eumeta japonica]|uniref:Uncharacterized protein n=1 Tax=Eumeta variegata TaxID=151549 RepID=A0A4C1TQR6_EUMVA|nr:hypothetical protein EVAR_93681_1 [Eumeta japonica]
MENKELEIEPFMDGAKIDILCTTEYWLRDYQLLLGFVNHRVASCFTRGGAMRGGSFINIRNNSKFKERTDIVDLSVKCVIEIEQLVVMIKYRPPIHPMKYFNRSWITPDFTQLRVFRYFLAGRARGPITPRRGGAARRRLSLALLPFQRNRSRAVKELSCAAAGFIRPLRPPRR